MYCREETVHLARRSALLVWARKFVLCFSSGDSRVILPVGSVYKPMKLRFLATQWIG